MRICTVDSRGLVTQARPDLEDFKAAYARPIEEVATYVCRDPGHITLEETVRNFRPTILIGTSGTAGLFTEAVVRAMAEGALGRTQANVAIAVSGIAGPDGAVPGKPVGTVWFALAHRVEERLECQGHLIQFDGNRDAVRRQAVEYALNLLRALPQPV